MLMVVAQRLRGRGDRQCQEQSAHAKQPSHAQY
jgi:hypothetical protein